MVLRLTDKSGGHVSLLKSEIRNIYEQDGWMVVVYGGERVFVRESKKDVERKYASLPRKYKKRNTRDVSA